MCENGKYVLCYFIDNVISNQCVLDKVYVCKFTFLCVVKEQLREVICDIFYFHEEM